MNLDKNKEGNFQTSTEPAYKYDKELVEQVLNQYKIDHTPELIKTLREGKESKLVENYQDENGSAKDGKFKITTNTAGKTEVHQNKVNHGPLEIPDAILGVKLNKAAKLSLSKGESLVVKTNFNKYVVKLDKDVNKITVKSTKEIGIPTELGKYKLTDHDIKTLADGKAMEPKVMYDAKTGIHVLANVKMTDDNKGLEFTNVKELTKAEASILIEKYNNVKVENSIANIGAEVINNAPEKTTGKESPGTNIATDTVKKQSTEQVVGNSLNTSEIKDKANIASKSPEIAPSKASEVSAVLNNKTEHANAGTKTEGPSTVKPIEVSAGLTNKVQEAIMHKDTKAIEKLFNKDPKQVTASLKSLEGTKPYKNLDQASKVMLSVLTEGNADKHITEAKNKSKIAGIPKDIVKDLSKSLDKTTEQTSKADKKAEIKQGLSQAM